SSSPVGYRRRVRLSEEEARVALQLLSLPRPERFVHGPPVVEQELFEEVSLGVLSARQSTNYRGQREVLLGADDSARAAEILRDLVDREAPVLDDATHTHLVLTRPYRTPFTMLLTLVGHRPILSPLTTLVRAARKRAFGEHDIPTIGYLTHLHLGILAEAIERAAVVASRGRRMAQVYTAPFCEPARRDNRRLIRALEELCGLSAADRARGWRLDLVAQVGHVEPAARVDMPEKTCRKIGANLLAFRSERIQPGVNQDPQAPIAYQARQDMDVPEALTLMAGRAGYNAFGHWTGCDRERSKELLLLERIDVLSPGGKERLRGIRRELDSLTDRVIADLPLWADLPTGRALSRNAARGKKAFALAGQRIYIGGLPRAEVEAEGIGWERGIRAMGASAARSSLYAELMGVVDLPDDCDLLAGVCLMAGPVNQNDIGKRFFRYPDLLADRFKGRDPTSLLVWTLKAKTIADPIGNEEQLLNPGKKGALVDLRPGPHEAVTIRRGSPGAPRFEPMRAAGSERNQERAFADVGNFATSPDGAEIPGNHGRPWPRSDEPVW
ncbi:MAG: hypothetical protein KC636_33460, partial [Myxococcales bacterium]|nr:hypothetical protein [Myxococcales bacterium]